MAMSSDHLRDASIVVIGAGVVGAVASYRLAQAGARVTTIDQAFPGGGTSGSSFAWLNGFNKTPRHYNRLNIHSIRDHQDLADELNGTWLHLDGALHWEREDDAIRLDRLQAGIRRIREWGGRVDTLTPEQVTRELEPDLKIDPEFVSEVYLVPREGWLEGIPMAHSVLQAARQRYGAKFETGRVVEMRGPAGAVDQVILEDGRTFNADVIVNAAGPSAARIAELAGTTLPIDRQLGMVCSTSTVPASLRHVTYYGYAHIRPEGGGRYTIRPEYLDAYAVEGAPVPVDHEVVQRALVDCAEALPALALGRIESVRVGVRPMPRDGHPVVGFDPRVSGLYHLVTHSGVTLSARLGVLMTEELTGGDTTDLEPYRPERFDA